MTSAHDHATHTDHAHEHSSACGHPAIDHEGHTDYAHEGHLHHPHDEHVDEHTLPASDRYPAACTPEHDCAAHDPVHTHGSACGHTAVPHADHTDYLVDGHLHHPHEEHCDAHGPLATV